MGQQIRDWLELALLLGLAWTQLARWSQKTEDAPADASRIAQEALKKTEGFGYELRKHKHSWQDFRTTQFSELDKVYARKREVELELQNLRDKQDTDCDRITALEEKVGRLSGV